jgi:hypothetical protein
MKEEEIFDHGWYNPMVDLPEVDWSEPDDEGKKYWHPRPILLLRKIKLYDGLIYTISFGEWDTTGIPAEWRVWEEHKDEEGYYDCGGKIVTDVIAWMPCPNFPSNVWFESLSSRHILG